MADALQFDDLRQWRGEWWLPSSPAKRAAGTLTFDPLHGARLELVGALRVDDPGHHGPASIALANQSGWFPVVHGAVNTKRVTLIDCIVTGENRTWTSEDQSAVQDLQATTILFGSHLGQEAELRFDKVVASIEGLTAWSGTPAIKIALDFPLRKWTITTDQPKDESLTVGDVTYTLVNTVEPPTHEFGVEATHAGVRHRVELEVSSSTPMGFGAALEHVAAVADLIALAGHRRTPLLSLRALPANAHPEAGPGDTWVNVLYQQTATERASEEMGSLAFVASDTSFGRVLGNWLNIRAQFKNAVNMVIATWSPGWYLEAETLNIITALESLDAGRGAAPKIPSAGFRELRKKLLRNIPQEHHQWILGVVQNRLSLQDRLRRVAESIPAGSRERLLPSIDAWARMAKTVRNDLSHSGASSVAPHAMAALAQISEAVAYLALLSMVGVPDSRIEELLARDSRLAHDCELASQYFPSASESA